MWTPENMMIGYWVIGESMRLTYTVIEKDGGLIPFYEVYAPRGINVIAFRSMLGQMHAPPNRKIIEEHFVMNENGWQTVSKIVLDFYEEDIYYCMCGTQKPECNQFMHGHRYYWNG